MKIVILTTDNREQFKTYEQPVPSFGTAPEALLQGFAALPEVEVHVLSCLRRPVRSPDKLANNIWFHSLYVPKIGWLSTGYTGCIRAVRKQLKQIQPNIVHGQGTERDCAICAVFSGFPNVITLHGNMVDVARVLQARVGSYLWLAARLETFCLQRTAGVFCNSTFTENLVRSRAKRFWRVPNAVRKDFFEAPLSGERSKSVILNVGLICAYKRQLEILQIAHLLHGEGAEFRFLGSLTGDMAYRAAFLEGIKMAEKQRYAAYLGFKDGKALIEAYDQAAALVHVPSSEAFGLVVAEALTRNLKVFASNVGGIPDIAAGVEGIELFPDGNWKGLQEGIARWIRSGSPKPQKVSAVMRQRYHPERIARRHLEIYREVLKSNP